MGREKVLLIIFGEMVLLGVNEAPNGGEPTSPTRAEACVLVL